MARKPAERVAFTEVETTPETAKTQSKPEKKAKDEKKKGLVHQVAVYYYSFLKKAKDEYFGYKQKDAKGKEIPFDFDVTKLVFKETFLHALNRNIRILKKAFDRQKEQNDDFLEAFKKEYEIDDEKLSDERYNEEAQEKYKEFLKTKANKEIQKKLDEEPFEGKIYTIDLKDLEDCNMPEDYFEQFERIMVKKESEGQEEDKEEEPDGE